ncbi:MAG: type I-E CRISPR-associated protein Cse1/CasA, partial [Methermicoccaceae archaeon]
WMAHTLTSEKGQRIAPLDVHPAQLFWAMPRRIRIDFKHTESGTCDVCGCDGDGLVSEYTTKSYGGNYEGSWLHPLSPYRVDSKGEKIPQPQHPHPDGITYRHWLAVVQGSSRRNLKIASVVQRVKSGGPVVAALRELSLYPPRLWAFGYDFDNMKAHCWYESVMPVWFIEENIRERYEKAVDDLVEMAEYALSNIRRAVKKAISKDGRLKGDISMLGARFWHDTEAGFYRALGLLHKELLASDENGVRAVKLEWHTELMREAETLFDCYAQTDFIGILNPKRIAEAHREMRRDTARRSKTMRKLLDLPAEKRLAEKASESKEDDESTEGKK